MKTFTPTTAMVFGKPKKANERAEGKTKRVKKNRPKEIMVGPNGQEMHRDWLLIDAKNMVLGRMACQIANFLRGKHKPTFTHTMDMGDFVVVINAGEIKLTGNKEEAKLYHRHSGYPGGMRADTYGSLKEKTPDLMLWVAVKRMLPRNKLRLKLMRKLKVYKGAEHPHAAQQPKTVDLSKVL